MTSKRHQIMQKVKPLYDFRSRISEQLIKAKKAKDAEAIKIWERVWFAVSDEIVALHEANWAELESDDGHRELYLSADD
jgi:hypothetical protein